jgi:hypothetical protein
VSTTIPTLTNEQLTASLLNLSFDLSAQGNTIDSLRNEFRKLCALLTGCPPPPPPIATPMTMALPPLTAPLLLGDASHTLLPPSSGVPLHRLLFPRSPSQPPPWLLGSTTSVVVSSPPPRTTAERQPPPQTTAAASRGGAPTLGTLYGGVDGTIISSISAAAGDVTESSAREAALEFTQGQAAPRFYKLEFPTYDGTVDPLNWINQCEQFFRGQRTLASDQTWLASYHLTGAAQTWYFAIKQDEGMPTWARFKELCHLQFGTAVRGPRLAELECLQFTTTVQDYADRFNAVLCHARNLDPVQKAELFVGGLSDHIRVDVEMRAPQDLSTAVYLARAFELRAAAVATLRPLDTPRPARQHQQRFQQAPAARPALPPSAAVPAGDAPQAPAAAPPPPIRQFRRLTPAE